MPAQRYGLCQHVMHQNFTHVVVNLTSNLALSYSCSMFPLPLLTFAQSQTFLSTRGYPSFQELSLAVSILPSSINTHVPLTSKGWHKIWQTVAKHRQSAYSYFLGKQFSVRSGREEEPVLAPRILFGLQSISLVAFTTYIAELCFLSPPPTVK